MHVVSRVAHEFPLYGYVLIGWAAGVLAGLGGWLWGYYRRRRLGLTLGVIAGLLYVSDLWILLACS